MAKEIWKRVPLYGGQIEASSLGRIRNAKTKVLRKLTPLKYYDYLAINIRHKGKSYVVKVHTLIARAFLGPRPSGQHVCHNDNDGTNNKVSNLRYDTPKGNSDDKYKHGTNVYGEKVWSSKLTEEDVLAIRRMYVPGEMTYTEIATKFGISPSHVGGIIKRRYWPHLTDDGRLLPHDEWAANEDRGNNVFRRSTKLMAGGERLRVSQWAKRLGTSKERIYQRLAKGWSVEDAVLTPVREHGRRIRAFGKSLGVEGLCPTNRLFRLLFKAARTNFEAAGQLCGMLCDLNDRATTPYYSNDFRHTSRSRNSGTV